MLAPVEPHLPERSLCKLLESVTLARGNHEVRSGGLLQHAPHRVYIFGSPTPVSLDLNISQREARTLAPGDTDRRSDTLLSHETLRTQRVFVIEQNSGARMQPVCVPVVRQEPVRRPLPHGVGAARTEGGILICRAASRVS